MVSIYIDSRSPRIFHSSIRCIFLETLGTLGLLWAAGSSFLMQLFCWCKLLFVLYPDPWHFYGSNVWSALQIRGHFQDDAAIKWPLKRKIRLVISTRVILVWRALGKISKRQRKNAYKRLRESSFFHLILKSEIRILLREQRSEKWKITLVSK